MYSRAVRGVSRFADRLGHRRMRVDGANELLDRRLQPQRQSGLRNELGRSHTDHVHAEHLVVFFLRDDLHEALCFAGHLRASEDAEWDGPPPKAEPRFWPSPSRDPELLISGSQYVQPGT